jgi:hypothetical protein
MDLDLGGLAFGGKPWQADDGTLYPPIPWGSETNSWKGMHRKYPACPGCGVSKGQFHTSGCTVEQIPIPLTAAGEPRDIPSVFADVGKSRLPKPNLRPLVRWTFARWYRMLLVLWLLVGLVRSCQ